MNTLRFSRYISRYDVVIAGNGLVGSAVAKAISDRAHIKVLVLDKSERKAKEVSRAHSETRLFTMRHSNRDAVSFAMMSRRFYEDMIDLGYDIGIHKCDSSYTIASSRERCIENRRIQSMLREAHISSDIMSGYEFKNMFPSVNCSQIQNALRIDGDLLVDSSKLKAAFNNEAQLKGVEFDLNCEIERVVTSSFEMDVTNTVAGIETNKGFIETSVFINCSGIWSLPLGLKTDKPINACIWPCQVVTFEIEMDASIRYIPEVMIDPEYSCWLMKSTNGRCDPNVLLVTTFGFPNTSYPGRKSKCDLFIEMCLDKKRDNDFDFKGKVNWDNVAQALFSIRDRIDNLNDSVRIRRVMERMDTFSMDHMFVCGEIPKVKNYFVVGGMHAMGLSFTGAAARLLQLQLCQTERSQHNLASVSPARFAYANDNLMYLKHKAEDIACNQFYISQNRTDISLLSGGRPLRISPLYYRLKTAGAFFGCTAGYEWPLFFDKQNIHQHMSDAKIGMSSSRPNYFEAMANEYSAVKHNVAIADLSGHVKIFIESEDAEDFLDRLCCNEIRSMQDMELRRIFMLNKYGTLENDMNMIKLSKNNYLMIGPCKQSTRAMTWLQRHLKQNENVRLGDNTAKYALLSIMGPNAKSLLRNASNDQPAQFKDFTCSTAEVMDVGFVSDVLIMHESFCGIDGFAMLVAAESAIALYDYLMECGYAYGIMNVGIEAVRTIRIENGMVEWGAELSSLVTPFECNRGHLVDLSKNFVGKSHLIQRDASPTKRLCKFVLRNFDMFDVWPTSGCPIYNTKTGNPVGFLTSSAFSFELNTPVGLGFLTKDFIDLKNTELFVDVAGHKYPVEVDCEQLDQRMPELSS
ncbi:hypothetical protein ACOME3_007497 [Neoechinorhynchus agilis]